MCLSPVYISAMSLFLISSGLQCIATMGCGYALCSTFVPGDRHVLIGTKVISTGHNISVMILWFSKRSPSSFLSPLQSGGIQLFELPSNSLLEEISAHDGAVWALSLSPDKRGVVSCSADHTVKFWEFELVQQPSQVGEGGGGESAGKRYSGCSICVTLNCVNVSTLLANGSLGVISVA